MHQAIYNINKHTYTLKRRRLYYRCCQPLIHLDYPLSSVFELTHLSTVTFALASELAILIAVAALHKRLRSFLASDEGSERVMRHSLTFPLITITYFDI